MGTGMADGLAAFPGRKVPAGQSDSLPMRMRIRWWIADAVPRDSAWREVVSCAVMPEPSKKVL
jgi:hypothetical protein